MVGYAYSHDTGRDYRNILIKVFECDNHALITGSTPFRIYCVERTSGKLCEMKDISDESVSRLGIFHAQKIVNMLESSEMEHNYPVCIEWIITHTGNCVQKSSVDLTTAWPFLPELFHSENLYFNISDICFSHFPSFLEVSFLCEVLNEAAYHCGIYNPALFIMCGNQLFCSSDIARIVKRLFKTDIMLSEISGFGHYRKFFPLGLTKSIVRKTAGLRIEKGTVATDKASIIAEVKRECVGGICCALKSSLESKKSFRRFKREVLLAVAESMEELNGLGSEILFVPSVKHSTDIGYLEFNQVVEAFAFADKKQKLAQLIRKNQNRYRTLKAFDVPDIIYKGKFFYKECR